MPYTHDCVKQTASGRRARRPPSSGLRDDQAAGSGVRGKGDSEEVYAYTRADSTLLPSRNYHTTL